MARKVRQTAAATVAIGGLLLTMALVDSASAAETDPTARSHSLDGTGNNAQHASWGAANTAMIRRAAAAYGDGVSAPAGASRPSARAVSNALSHQDGSVVNARHLSDFIYVWGQFLDHDINLTSGGSEQFAIAVPTGDPSFDPDGTGLMSMRFTRSLAADGSGTGSANPRQQVDGVSAFIDGSQIYGSDATRAAALRTFTGGELRTGAGNLMPRNTDGLPNANDSHMLADDRLFLAGDVRANENPDLIAIQTLFVREHNRIARQTLRTHPDWSDERVFQRARSIVIAELQAITFNEYLPALLGRDAIRPYRGYRSDVDPTIANEFATAAFRFGHSVLDGEIARLNDDGTPAAEPLTLRESFFNASVFDTTLPDHAGDIDPYLKGAASGNAQEIDLLLVDDVRDFLFGAPGQGGFDLAALNIQRGRDHGLADYNSTRAAYGLPRAHSFAEITRDPELQEQLEALYGTVDDIDVWVGGLAEDHVPGSSVGPLFQRIIVDQFLRLRSGDRLWYERTFSGRDLAALRGTHLSDVIRSNTSLRNLQENVFTWNGSVGRTDRRPGRSLAPMQHR